MFYAAENQVSTEPFEGAVEIENDSLYNLAVDAMIDGKIVKFESGELVITEPPAPELSEPIIPEPVFPDRVTRRQFMMQLEISGIYDEVTEWVTRQERIIRIAFAESGTFVLSDPMLHLGFDSLGFTQEQIDEFFIAASQL